VRRFQTAVMPVPWRRPRPPQRVATITVSSALTPSASKVCSKILGAASGSDVARGHHQLYDAVQPLLLEVAQQRLSAESVLVTQATR